MANKAEYLRLKAEIIMYQNEIKRTEFMEFKYKEELRAGIRLCKKLLKTYKK